MLLVRGALTREFETTQPESQRSPLTQHLTAATSPQSPTESDSISNASASVPRVAREERPSEFVGASGSNPEPARESKLKRRRSESVESQVEIPSREAATKATAARSELDAGDAKSREGISRELSLWEKLVFTFDRDRDDNKDQRSRMNRDGSDSVGVGGSGQHRGNPSGGDRDGNVAERERDMESGRSRRGPTPSSSTGPGGVISPLATRRITPSLVGPGRDLRINTGDASGSDMARTHSQRQPLSTSSLHQSHLPLSSHQQQQDLSFQEHSPPPHPLLTPASSAPIQGPLGPLDPYTVAQLAAISVMYPQSGVPDPYELINRAQRPQATGYSPPLGSSASGYAQQHSQHQHQHQHLNQALNNPAHHHQQHGHGAPAHPQHRSQGHLQQQQHQQHHLHGGQNPHVMGSASSTAQWQTSPVQHMNQLSLHPTHSQQGSSGHGHGQQQLAYGHNYPDLFATPAVAGSSHSALTRGHGERTMSSSSHSVGYASSSSPPMSPAQQQDQVGGDLDDSAIAEDKRRRNTLASARFRIKKKHKILELERSVVELEGRADDLEREASDLRRENGWLKEMLIMKGRRARGLEPPATEASKDSSEEDSDEESAGGNKASKGKGKEKEKGA